MKNIFCFGELLLRMSPALHGAWIEKNKMNVYVGGAELNAANALAKWNVPVQYCTALPDHYLAKEIIAHLQQKNIDTSPILFSGNRIGTYYLPQGTDLKNAGVIYDRAYSSFSELKPGMIDWSYLLKDAQWFHFSAISPALNESTALVCEEAAAAASKMGLTISIDLNYRAKLWQYGKQPKEIMPHLLQYCNVVMGNIWSAGSLLGIYPDDTMTGEENKEAYLQQSFNTSIEIMRQYPQCEAVANTFRFDDDEGIHYYATYQAEAKQYVSKTYRAAKVIDKVGSGDCFMAGLIYGAYHKLAPQRIIDFAAAAAVGKMQETGDCTQQNAADIEMNAWH